MFISKKKWNEMHKEFYRRFEQLEKDNNSKHSRIEELEFKLKVLENAHTIGWQGYQCINNHLIPYRYTHEDICITTEKCGDVTLKELAQFVIDRKPIERIVQTTTVLNPPPCGDTCAATVNCKDLEVLYESKS